MIITTTDTLEGYRIIEYLGVIGNNKGGSFFLNTISTKKSTEELGIRAETELGANAIIGLRYSNYTENGKGVMHMYGTAVKVEKID